MIEAVIKVFSSAAIIVLVSEVAKRSAVFAGIVASIPLTSVLAMIWLYRDTGDGERIIALSESVFWLVLPSLVFFLVLPFLIRKGLGVYSSIFLSLVLMSLSYAGMLGLMRFWSK